MNDSALSLKYLDGKKISVKLKYGYTLEDFARQYNCSEEELLNFLEKNFDSKAFKGILSYMKKNAKRKKEVKTSNPVVLIKSETILSSSEATNNFQEETSMESTNISTNSKHSSMKNVEKLEKLKATEKNLRDKIFSDENSHNDLISQRRVLFKQLQEQKSLMLQLRKEIEQRKQELEGISTKLFDLSNNIISINAELSANRKKLSDVQAEIKTLETIPIFIYENGEIDTDDFLIDLPDTWTTVFDNILKNDLVEDLSVKQIKQLSKLLVMVHILADNNLDYELTFESEISKKAFDELQKTCCN